MQRWSLGFFSVAAFVATFGFGGLSSDGMVVARLLCILFLGIFGIVLVYRLRFPQKPPPVNLHLRNAATQPPSSYARATATRP
jgi:uncharacterized membrane protein YtjA (UPF0391 family)